MTEGKEGARRVWILRQGEWLSPHSLTDKPHPWVFRGGDEFGNATLCFRFGTSVLVIGVTFPLRRHRLVGAISTDVEADMVLIDFQTEEGVARTDQVGASLLANYGVTGELVSIEVLCRAALGRPQVMTDLAGLVPDYVYDDLVYEALPIAGWTLDDQP